MAQRHRVRRKPPVLTPESGKGSPGNDSDTSGHLQVPKILRVWGTSPTGRAVFSRGCSKRTLLLIFSSRGLAPTKSECVGGAQRREGMKAEALGSRREAQGTRTYRGDYGGGTGKVYKPLGFSLSHTRVGLTLESIPETWRTDTAQAPDGPLNSTDMRQIQMTQQNLQTWA